MTWQEDVADRVKEAEEEVEGFLPRKYAAELKIFLDRFLPYALILLGSLLTLNFLVEIGSRAANMINILNWALISYFSLRLAMAFRLAESDTAFLKQHWFDALLVIPAFTLLQEFRALIALEEIGIGEEEAAAGLIASRNAGLAAQITRIIRIVKRSLSF
ncbi:MAG: hypothetical protein ABEK16_04280 [Candidatus Nanohalobium sp.]